jgi:hypothetical protein
LAAFFLHLRPASLAAMHLAATCSAEGNASPRCQQKKISPGAERPEAKLIEVRARGYRRGAPRPSVSSPQSYKARAGSSGGAPPRQTLRRSVSDGQRSASCFAATRPPSLVVGALHAAHARHDANGGARFFLRTRRARSILTRRLNANAPTRFQQIAFARSESSSAQKSCYPCAAAGALSALADIA